MMMFIARVKIMLGSPGVILSEYIFGNDYKPALHKIVTRFYLSSLKMFIKFILKSMCRDLISDIFNCKSRDTCNSDDIEIEPNLTNS